MVHSRIYCTIALVAISLTGTVDRAVAEMSAPVPSNGYSVLGNRRPTESLPLPAAMDLWEEPLAGETATCDCMAASCEICNSCSSWCSPRWYGQTDFLTWWTKGNKLPPLVTTSPDGTARANAGVLGQPGTQILHGGQGVDGNYRIGVRLLIGRWMDECKSTGIEMTWFSVGDGANTGNFYAQSVGTPLSPILARPFFNILANQQDASLVAFPNLIEGSIDVRTSSEMHSMALLLRRSLWQSCGDRVDVVGGYRYFRYREGLTIEENLRVTEVAGPVAVGTTIDLLDSFSTENDFHGGEIGVAAVLDRGPWSLDLLSKIAVGNMHQTVNVQGMNVVTIPNQAPVATPGGLLALSTNSGEQNRNDFAFLPELNLNLRYCYSQNISLAMGYSLLWVTNVMRTGDQIDTGINVSQLPANGNNLIGPPRPAPVLSDTSMWVQGLNLGVVWQY